MLLELFGNSRKHLEDLNPKYWDVQKVRDHLEFLVEAMIDGDLHQWRPLLKMHTLFRDYPKELMMISRDYAERSVFILLETYPEIVQEFCELFNFVVSEEITYLQSSTIEVPWKRERIQTLYRIRRSVTERCSVSV